MRGMPWRLPYWPWLIRIGLSSPSRSGIVSWSASKDRATAQRAPPGQALGARLRPARARSTMRRHTSSGHSHASPAGCFAPSFIWLSLVTVWPMLHALKRNRKSRMTADDPALMTAEDLLGHYARGTLSPIEVL